MFDTFKKKLQEPKLIMTSTEELFIPVRLYYKLHNKKFLIKALKKLKCVLFSEDNDDHFILRLQYKATYL